MSRLRKPSVDSVECCSCKCAAGSGLLPTNNCAAAAASTTPHHESGHRTPAIADTPDCNRPRLKTTRDKTVV